MGNGSTTLGFVALLLLGNICSLHAWSATIQQDTAAARQLLDAKDLVSAAGVSAACNPPANSSTWTTVGCRFGCQSCKKKRSSSGTRDCVCCKAGYVPSTTSNATCTACPVGSIAARAGSTRCSNCTRGLTTDRPAATTCDACPAGRELKPGAKPPACRLCAAGYISPGGLLTAKPTCTRCSGNMTTLGLDRVRCDGCKPGSAGPSCEVCKPGFWSAGGAATSANKCRACPDGTFTLGVGATARAACRNTTIAINTTFPINLTTTAVFSLANATCSDGLNAAVVAKYNEENQKAAAADGFELNIVTEVVNCTDIAGSSSGRRLSVIPGITFAQIVTSSTISSVIYTYDVGADTTLTWFNIFGSPGMNNGNAFTRYWGAVGQSYVNAALLSLSSGGAITSGGISFSIASADVSQFQLSGANGAFSIISNSAYCLTAPASSLWQLPEGVDLAIPAWQLACSSTPKGQSCTAAACDKGAGDLTAMCGQDGKWSGGSGSCTPLTCEKAAPPAFPATGATFTAATWAAACGSTLPGNECVTTTACSSGQGLSAICEYLPVAGNLVATWTKLKGSCTDVAAAPHVQCSSAPADVPTLGGAVFLSEPWIATCGQTQENATCTVVDAACSASGTISAKCTKGADGGGVWINVQGSCRAPAAPNATAACGSTPMPSATIGWTTNGAPLDDAAWTAACSKAVQGQTCSAAACGVGFSGTLSAVCQVDGRWGQLSGTCNAVVRTCSGAPSSVPITGGASFIPNAWVAACGSTTRGNSCSTSNACSAGSTGTINAACDLAGDWQLVSGGCIAGHCSGAPNPSTVPTTGGASFIPSAWTAACNSTTRGNSCSTSSACSDGSSGTINATCSLAGNWTYTSGKCIAGICSGAPDTSLVPTTGDAVFIPGAWAAACNSTTRGNSCSTSSACSDGSSGTINAMCTVAGNWTYTSGTCAATPASLGFTTPVAPLVVANAQPLIPTPTSIGSSTFVVAATYARPGVSDLSKIPVTLAATGSAAVGLTCTPGLASAQVTTSVGLSSWRCSSNTPGTLTFSASSPNPLVNGTTLSTGPSVVITVATPGGLELRLAATAIASSSCNTILSSTGSALKAGLLQDLSPGGGASGLSVAMGSIPDIQLQCSQDPRGTYELRALITYLSTATSNTAALAAAAAVNNGDMCAVIPAACSAFNGAGSGVVLAPGQSTAETFDPTTPQPRLELSSTCPTLAATQIAVTVENPVKPLNCTVTASYWCPGLLDLGGASITLTAAGTAVAGLACLPAIGSIQTTQAGSGSRRQLVWRCDGSNTPGTLTFSASSTIPAPLAGSGPAAGPTSPITIGQPQGVEVLFAATLDCDLRYSWSFPWTKKPCASLALPTDVRESLSCANAVGGQLNCQSLDYYPIGVESCACVPKDNAVLDNVCRSRQELNAPCTPNFRCSTPAVASAVASIRAGMLAYIQSKAGSGGSNGDVVSNSAQVVVTCEDQLYTGLGFINTIRPRLLTSATAGGSGPGSFHLRIVLNYLTISASTALAESIVSTLMGNNTPNSARDYFSSGVSGYLNFCAGADELSFICSSWSAAGPEFDMSKKFTSSAGVPWDYARMPDFFAATTFDPVSPAKFGLSAYGQARQASSLPDLLSQPQQTATITRALPCGGYGPGQSIFPDETVPAIAYLQPGVAPLSGIAVNLTLAPGSTGGVSCTFGLGGPLLTTDASGFIPTNWSCTATSAGTITLVMSTPGVAGASIAFGPATVFASGSGCVGGGDNWGVVPLR